MQRKFFEIVPADVNYEFVGSKRKFLGFSAILLIASLVLLFTRGLNFGIDFSGGTEIQVRFSDKIPAAKLKQEQVIKDIDKAFPTIKNEIQGFGTTGREYLLKFETISLLNEKDQKNLEQGFKTAFAGSKDQKILSFRLREEGGNKVEIRFSRQLKAAATPKPTTQPTTAAASQPNDLSKIADEFERIRQIFASQKLGKVEIGEPSGNAKEGFEYALSFSGLSVKVGEVLENLYGAGMYKIERVETVGPRVGRQLRDQGILAILLAMFFILIYIAIRFDFRYAPGAVAALLHDVIITMGVFSALYIPFDLSIIAALLTIVGYSLNDTIVVFDRIRENWQKSRFDFGEVMNRSINETLSRTLLTSMTTFVAVTPIFVLGGSNIRWFAFAMMFGIVIGTYSSIAIASPIVHYLDGYFSREERAQEEESQQKREERRLRRKGLA
jgi:preprotein translocase subunit SecF